MAEPILLELPPRDARAELQDRLDRAPLEHAEALLESYEVIQALHNAGILNLLHGLLSSGNQVLGEVVGALNEPGSLRAIRNLLILVKVAESIEPEVLAKVASSIPQVLNAVSDAQRSEPPTVVQSIKLATSGNFRRGLGALAGALDVLHHSATETETPEATNSPR